MRRCGRWAPIAVASWLGAAPFLAGQTPAGPFWDEVGQTLQSPVTLTGGYYRYGFPRRDLVVRVGDVLVAPALALGGWIGFSGDSTDAVAMGDLVVTSGELGPVLDELARQRIPVTAIHNHLVGEQPAVTYVHFHAEGVALDLAGRLDQAVARTGAPRPVVPPAPQPVTIDTALVWNALGLRGRASGSVAQVSTVLVPGPVLVHGRTMIPMLAYASPINLQAVSQERAVATGDFAVLEEKVTPVLRALASHGITATAVHSHLLGEVPALSFIHFWADGPLDQVTRGLRAAIDASR
jgi:hypothetical protein